MARAGEAVRAQARGEARREVAQLGARRALVAGVRDDVVGRRRRAASASEVTRSRRAAGDPRPRAGGRCASGERRVDEQRALHVGAERDEPGPPRCERGAVPRLFEVRPRLPVGKRPDHDRLGVVAHRDAERADEAQVEPFHRADPDFGERFEERGATVPTGIVTSSCAYTSPRTPSATSSSIVGLHGSGTTMRSKPPRRSSRGDRPPLGERRDPARRTPELVLEVRRRDRPSRSSSHMFTTSGQRPVEPTVAHTPKQCMLRSAIAVGHQFAVMWCMYLARLCPMMSMNSWM